MNNERWNVFLSLQGNDINSPPPEKEITRPFKETYKLINDLGIFEYFKDSNKILIIGAGDGSEVMSFKIRNFNAEGTTWHHSDKKFAKINYDIDLIVEDMHNMTSFHSNYFDGIYSYHVLEHSIAPIMALYEMRRILKVNGKIFCVVPSSSSNDEAGIQHYSVLRNEHWRHLLNIIGFDNIKIENIPDSIIIKAIKGTRDCPGKHFENELNKLYSV